MTAHYLSQTIEETVEQTGKGVVALGMASEAEWRYVRKCRNTEAAQKAKKLMKKMHGFGAPKKNKNNKRERDVSYADGLDLIKHGKLQKAEHVFRILLKTHAKSADFMANFGALLNQLEKYDEAISILKSSIATDPINRSALVNLGNSYIQTKRPQEALMLYKRVIDVNPSDAIALYNAGTASMQLGHLEDAISYLENAANLQKGNPNVLSNLGLALQQHGDINNAIASYKKALKLNPNFAEAHHNLGIALKIQGDPKSAILSFNTALEIKPNYPEVLANLGNALIDLGDLNTAISSFNRALEINPNLSEVHNNLGATLLDIGDADAAATSFKRAVDLTPENPEAHYNVGNAYLAIGDVNSAISSYKRAINLKDDYPEAHWNQAQALLLSGSYKTGWREYEWRSKKIDPLNPHARPKCERWRGELPTHQANPFILVSEQGIGDTLQFMRYATALRNQNIPVSLCAQTKLHGLIKASGIDPSPLTPQQAMEAKEGQWMPLLSVPRILDVRPENPVINDPYITSDITSTTKWKEILSAEELPIVGINWQGNPDAEKRILSGRSLPLECFEPIATQSKFKLLSLQKGFGSEQLETCSFKNRFVSCQGKVNDSWDFLETAAIIANCDLVITSDTSVAHLAGGMGKTTWLLLHKVPEWRWGLEGDTTFWYPSMRLFRQKERGNWNEVMTRVAEALEEHFGNSSAPAKPNATAQSALKPKPIQDILAPISLGELIDKITILQIKTQHLQGTALGNVRKELEALEATLSNLQLNIDNTAIQRLKKANQDLWQIEDEIRDQERQKSFGKTFIELARSVYQKNDQRAAIKKEINTTYGSALTEEKSYQEY